VGADFNQEKHPLKEHRKCGMVCLSNHGMVDKRLATHGLQANHATLKMFQFVTSYSASFQLRQGYVGQVRMTFVYWKRRA
jgi:hypothetical protein